MGKRKEDIEIKITEAVLQCLFQGKKVVYERYKEQNVVLYPPNHGIFIPIEDLQQIRRLIMSSVMSSQTVDKLLELLK